MWKINRKEPEQKSSLNVWTRNSWHIWLRWGREGSSRHPPPPPQLQLVQSNFNYRIRLGIHFTFSPFLSLQRAHAKKEDLKQRILVSQTRILFKVFKSNSILLFLDFLFKMQKVPRRRGGTKLRRHCKGSCWHIPWRSSWSQACILPGGLPGETLHKISNY